MGGVHPSFVGYDLDELVACTFFTHAEIIHLHKVFTNLVKRFNKKETSKLELVEILTLKPLQYNPFAPRSHHTLSIAASSAARRLCKVFSEDGSGSLGFEEFLDMLSVFSPHADDEVRLSYIFRTYGSCMLNLAAL